MLNALASLLTGSIRLTASIHSLRRGLPGYLIPFAPHAFVPQCQKWTSILPTPLVFLPISTDFTPTLGIPDTSSILEFASSNNSLMVEPQDFTIRLTNHLRNSLRPVNPDNAWVLRMTAAAGT
jgi:hypothetical protein